MVTQYGMSPTLGNIDLSSLYKDLSTETRQRIEDEVRSMIDTSYTRALALLRDKRAELDLLATALVDYEVLDAKEVRMVLKGEKLERMKGDRKAPIRVPVTVPEDGEGSGGPGAEIPIPGIGGAGAGQPGGTPTPPPPPTPPTSS